MEPRRGRVTLGEAHRAMGVQGEARMGQQQGLEVRQAGYMAEQAEGMVLEAEVAAAADMALEAAVLSAAAMTMCVSEDRFSGSIAFNPLPV